MHQRDIFHESLNTIQLQPKRPVANPAGWVSTPTIEMLPARETPLLHVRVICEEVLYLYISYRYIVILRKLRIKIRIHRTYKGT